MKTSWRRIQILITEDQYHELRHAAAARHTSMGSVIRELIAKGVADPEKERRLQAAQRIISMNLPVDDWPVMEDQIEAARFGDGCPLP